MSGNYEEFSAVLKASYDYIPQSDDEIAIKEDQLLFLIEKVDDDWWKVKIKGNSQEEDTPVGLVPAAYVEQATHTSKVKALYDYEAAADGELSIKEDDILLVFESELDWILVQSQGIGGRAGFVPGNYVEPYTETEALPPRIIVPPPAQRPVSSYVDPADRVASSKVSADDIKTWSVSELDKKGKKKKGTLGIGNGAVFFASESDKTPVQKWQIVDVRNVTSEKVKHVVIDIGGAAPINLHFHAGSKDNVEEIITKAKSSQALASPSNSTDATRNSPSQASILEEMPAPKKASVHFSHSAPDIIPTPDEEDDDGEEEKEETHVEAGPSVNGSEQPNHQSGEAEIGVALYDFTADGDDELSIREGEQLTILEREGDDWWRCRNSKGEEGVVPASYIEIAALAQSADPVLKASSPAVLPDELEEDEEAAEEARRRVEEEERILKEQEAQKAEQARKKAEAQKRAKEAAIAAELERQRRKEAAAARSSHSPAVESEKGVTQISGSSNPKSRPSSENNRPPPDRTRIWHDRSGQFRVEAAFLGFNNGKLRLHKVNGVIVEVPSEKMSVEDMKFVEHLTSKKSRPAATKQVSEDDIPLGLTRSGTTAAHKQTRVVSKKAAQIDWFDFFLSAGCDLDDCTRYAASFERDKLDETLLPDITEGTMRSLGVREGDIIRVIKAIEKRKPTDNIRKPSMHIQEQVRRDEELARQLQAQEAGGTRAAAPNLFAAGPGGALKTQTRRGRPTPSKSLPPSQVDLKAISTVSGQIQRTSSPQVSSPTIAVGAPPRSSSAAPASGFDDDAWTNRPSSTKPTNTPTPRAPSAPPASVAVELPSKIQSASANPQAPTPASPQMATTQPASSAPAAASTNPSALAKTAESDIFDQLSRLGELRKQSMSAQPQATSPPIVTPPSYQVGLGMGSSPTPIGQLVQNSQLNSQQPSPQPYNGPRGPFAPVPANQSLLQPLIPTTTGFTGLVPTRTGLPVSQFLGSSPPFFSQQPVGHPGQPLMPQTTGLPAPGLNPTQHPGFASMQNQFTGFNSNLAHSPFNDSASPPLVPPLPNSLPVNNNSPANVFAQMKSGTFATENNTNPPMLTAQATGWSQPYQGGYMGFQR